MVVLIVNDPYQQELLHLQVVAIFRVTFLIVIEAPPFFNA